MDLSGYNLLVEEALLDLNVDILQSRGEFSGQWNIKKGKSSLWVDVFENKNSQMAFFQCISPIFDVPEGNNNDVYEQLLERNHTIFGAKITKLNNTIYLKTMIKTDGLTKDIIFDSINTISFFSEKLIEEFRK